MCASRDGRSSSSEWSASKLKVGDMNERCRSGVQEDISFIAAVRGQFGHQHGAQ